MGLDLVCRKAVEAKPNDALPVDIVSDQQFSEITRGVQNAGEGQAAGPWRKVGETKPIDN